MHAYIMQSTLFYVHASRVICQHIPILYFSGAVQPKLMSNDNSLLEEYLHPGVILQL